MARITHNFCLEQFGGACRNQARIPRMAGGVSQVIDAVFRLIDRSPILGRWMLCVVFEQDPKL